MRKNRILPIAMVLILIIYTGYAIREYWYLPYHFKKVYYEGFRNDPKYAQISDENIELCVDCLYDGFHYFHGSVSNFPLKKDYDFYDVEVIYTCGARYLFDKKKSEFYFTHMDSLVNAYFVKDPQKEIQVKE